MTPFIVTMKTEKEGIVAVSAKVNSGAVTRENLSFLPEGVEVYEEGPAGSPTVRVKLAPGTVRVATSVVYKGKPESHPMFDHGTTEEAILTSDGQTVEVPVEDGRLVVTYRKAPWD